METLSAMKARAVTILSCCKSVLQHMTTLHCPLQGHEFMGIVEDVGPDVKNIQKGDRVVCSFDLGCGTCRFCKDLKLFSCCDITNPR